MGKVMWVVVDNVDLVKVFGINVEWVVMWIWVMIVVLIVLGGFMYGLMIILKLNMGWFLILFMFVLVILGGIGNFYGAIVGGIIIGVV